jgi:DNA-binding GntR family transcriptional regulator
MPKDKKTNRPLGRPKGAGSQLVYDELRNQILTLTLRPGTPIDELALVRMFSLSRTPVREALIKLEADGLVEIVPNRGASVAPMDFDSIGRLFEALDLYSRGICYLAATRGNQAAVDSAKRANLDFANAAQDKNFREMGEANWRFHTDLGIAAGNSFLADAQTRVLNESMRLAYLVHYSSVRIREDYKNYFAQIIQEHDQIIDLIRNGKAKEAERLAGQHTRLFQENVARYLMQNGLETISMSR